MLELIIISLLVVCIAKLILRHNNIFISNIKINIKFIGLNIEFQSKEKKHPSNQD